MKHLFKAVLKKLEIYLTFPFGITSKQIVIRILNHQDNNNPDIKSPGASIENLTNNQLWFNGPKFLYTQEIWPFFDQDKLLNPSEETKISLITNELFIDLKFIDITKFNSYSRLIRVTAYVIKFVSCLKNTQVKNDNLLLSSSELKNSKIIWIKFIQQNIYSSKNYKQLKKDFGFFFDSEGIIR